MHKDIIKCTKCTTKYKNAQIAPYSQRYGQGTDVFERVRTSRAAPAYGGTCPCSDPKITITLTHQAVFAGILGPFFPPYSQIITLIYCHINTRANHL